MVIVDLLYGLEVNDSFHLGLVFVWSRERKHNRLFSAGSKTADVSSKYRSLTCVIGERPAVVVKDEPTLLPGLYLSAHFDEEAPAGFVGDGQVEAGVRAVSSRLDVAVEIKVVFPHWEVAA